MEPLPETRRAIEEFGPFLSGDGDDDDDLLDLLKSSSRLVAAVVPSCLGMTLARPREGLAFTFVAEGLDLTAPGAVEDDDTRRHAAPSGGGSTTPVADDDPTDEARWARSARAGAAHGVASTLTLPILDGGVAHTSVNLYASTIDAFDGHHDEVAAIFGAWAGGAVTNADLSFDSAVVARGTPQVLAEEMNLARAIGVLVQRYAITLEEARARLCDAAARTGVDLAALARLIVRPPA